MKTIHETYFGMDRPGQRFGVDRILDVEGSRVRLDIMVDGSYHSQSRLISSVWANGWKEVARIYGTDPSLPDLSVSYVPAARGHEKEAVVEQIAERLLAATLPVIGPLEIISNPAWEAVTA